MSKPVGEQVIALLEKKGWIRGQMHSSDGYCLLGALSRLEQRSILTWNPRRYNRIREFQNTLHEQIRDDYLNRNRYAGPMGIPNWNDQFARRRSEVYAMLRRTDNVLAGNTQSKYKLVA